VWVNNWTQLNNNCNRNTDGNDKEKKAKEKKKKILIYSPQLYVINDDEKEEKKSVIIRNIISQSPLWAALVVWQIETFNFIYKILGIICSLLVFFFIIVVVWFVYNLILPIISRYV